MVTREFTTALQGLSVPGGISWKFSRILLKIPWEFHGFTMTLPRFSGPFLRGDLMPKPQMATLGKSERAKNPPAHVRLFVFHQVYNP